MTLVLTQARIDELQGYITAGNREAYYEALASWGSGYAELALGVVRNDTLAGRTANNYMAAYADQHNIAYSPVIQTQISVALMNADFDLRRDLFINDNYTGELSGKDIQDYHGIVLPINGFPPEAWSLEIGAQYYGDDFRDDALASESGFIQAMNLLFEHTIHPVLHPVQSVQPDYTNWLATLYKSAFQAAYDEAQESTPVAAYNFTQGLALGDLERLAEIPMNKLVSIITAIHDVNTELSSIVTDTFNTYQQIIRPPSLNNWLGGGWGDPLVLDMDRDGQADLISGADATSRMFDVDEDGFLEHVGWVSAQDGFLARDLDADGKITDQAELFGNLTTSGYTMLSALDSNSDGKIDINDTDFNTLVVWQDANQDGIGQATELVTLSVAGIKSIDVTFTNTNDWVQGNIITEQSWFTWNDNTQSRTWDVNVLINDLWSRYNEEYELDPQTLFLPQARGYGTLPDLHIAMSLNEDLLDKVKDFTEMSFANFRDIQKAAYEILIEWSGARETAPPALAGGSGFMTAEQWNLMNAIIGREVPSGDHNEMSVIADRFIQSFITRLIIDTQFKDALPNLTYNINADKFEGSVTYADLIDAMEAQAPTSLGDNISYWRQMAAIANEISTSLGHNKSLFETDFNTAMANTGVAFTYAQLMEMYAIQDVSINSGWGDHFGYDFREAVTSTGQHIFLARDDFDHATASPVGNHFTSGDDIIVGVMGGTSTTGGALLNGGDGNDLMFGTLFNDQISMGNGNNIAYGNEGNDRIIDSLGGNDIAYGGAGNDTIIMYDGNDALYGEDGNDIIEKTGVGIGLLYGGNGNDTIKGGLGNDTIYGGDGDDVITDKSGVDTIYGDSGNDTITGGGSSTQIIRGGDGDDILGFDSINYTSYSVEKYQYGEAGNDTLRVARGVNFLNGGEGDDTYIWNLYEIYNSNSYEVRPNGIYIEDASGNDQFKVYNPTGYTYTITAEQVGDDLLIYCNDRTITVTDQFADPNNLVIDSIWGSNGTFIDLHNWTPVSGVTWTGTNSAENYFGSDYSDFIYGLAGNDQLFGKQGNDYIEGGDGNDKLYGEGQDDILIGGKNNDNLYGGYGNDIYRFQVGDGQDTIDESEFESLNDRIEFTDGTTWENLNFDYTASKLDIYYGSSDRISTTHFNVLAEGFAGFVGARVETIKFSNATTYSIDSDVKLFVSYSTINQTFGNNVDIVQGYTNADTINLGGGNDTAKGNNGNDIINGDAGNDWLYGDAGNDTLDGGVGNDRLYGGADNDTYIASDGVDFISDASGTADKIVFGAGITSGDLQISKVLNGSYYDMIIEWGAGNQIKVSDAFRSTYFIETIQFADLSTIDLTTYTFTVKGTSAVDNISGTNSNEIIYGYGGNDILSGQGGDDTLYGGDDNDTLNGNDGNDVLHGENGADTLNGHNGNDTLYGGAAVDYLYGGNGNDTLHGGDGNDIMNGEADNDTLYGGEGGDNMGGGTGADTLYGEGGNDTIAGNDGDDILNGGDGADVLMGYNDNDTLIGGNGNDNLYGAYGNDTYVYSAGLDTADEAGGTDILKITGGISINDITTSKVSNNAKIVINAGIDEIIITNQHHASTDYHIERIVFDDGFSTTLEDHLTWTWGTTGNDTLTGTASNNTLIGKAGNDTLDGAGGDDDIHGGSGTDTLYGGDGADLLHGGVDNDILHGGDGLDTLIGGSGADTFAFESASAFNNVDTVMDFNAGQGDALKISDLLIGYTPGTSDINDFVSFTVSGSNTSLVIDRDGTAGAYNDQSIATLSNVTGLDVDDLFNNNQIIV